MERCIRYFPCTNSPPVCLSRIPWCWVGCEANRGCAKFGSCGLTVSPVLRKRIFYAAAALTTIGIVLSAIAVVGLSKSGSVLEQLSWTYGTATNQAGTRSAKFYIGLYAVQVKETVKTTDGVVVSENATLYTWDEATCSSSALPETNACENCKEAADGTLSTAVTGLVTYFPQLTTDLVRAFEDQDVRCQKAFGIITGLFSFCSTLYAISHFNNDCREHLNDLQGLSWHPGPGLVCITIATVLKVIDVSVHALIAVPDPPPAHERLAPTKKTKEQGDQQSGQGSDVAGQGGSDVAEVKIEMQGSTSTVESS